MTFLKAESPKYSIPEERQVILNKHSYRWKNTWTPSKNQTEIALIAISQYLDITWKQKKSMWPVADEKKVKHIKSNLSKFSVQFYGIGAEEKRQILCNFFPKTEHSDWKTVVVISPQKDKSLYWSITYSLDENTCFNFKYPWVKL